MKIQGGWNSPSLRFVLKKRDTKNFLFIGINNGITFAVRWPIKYFFALNLPMFWIEQEEKGEEGEEHMQMQSVMRFIQKQ